MQFNMCEAQPQILTVSVGISTKGAPDQDETTCKLKGPMQFRAQ